jgi:hypothetical protein
MDDLFSYLHSNSKAAASAKNRATVAVRQMITNAK